MKKELIRIRNVQYAIENKSVISRAGLYLFQGETLGIVGGYDSGKSALFEVLSGKGIPSEGYLFVKGRSTDWADFSARPKMKCLQSDWGLVDCMTIWENMLIEQSGGKIKYSWIPVKRVKRQFAELAEKYGLHVDVRQRADELTEYQKFAVSLLCARLNQADVILVENFNQEYSASDLEHLKSFLRKLNEEGVCIVLFSLNVGFMDELCHRIAIIRGGQVICSMEADPGSRGILSFLAGEMHQKIDYSLKPAAFDSVSFQKEKPREIAIGPYSFLACPGEYIAFVDLEHDYADLLFQNWEPEGKSGIYYQGKGICRGTVLVDISSMDRLVESMSPAENLYLGLYPQIAKGGLVFPHILRYLAHKLAQWMKDPSMEKRENCYGLKKRERIAISLFRLLLARPEVLLFQDLFYSTDLLTRQFVLEIFGELRAKGTSVCACVKTEKFGNFAQRYIVVSKGRFYDRLEYGQAQKLLGESGGCE